jgi:hypothetical protein
MRLQQIMTRTAESRATETPQQQTRLQQSCFSHGQLYVACSRV